MSSSTTNRSKTPVGRPTSRYNTQQQKQQATAASNAPSQAQNNAPPKEGRKLVGQYLLGKTIGEGTFGKVKIACHVPTGEKVAVKILEKSRIKDQADVRLVKIIKLHQLKLIFNLC